MKRCPTCGDASALDNLFCEADGARLTEEAAPQAALAARATCPSCAKANADDGDGYCVACGHRIGGNRTTPPLIPVGAKIGGGEIVSARASDEFVVRGADGRELTVTLGTEGDVAKELAALRALGGTAPFPDVVDHGADPRHGSYLAVTGLPANAQTLADAKLDLAAAIAMLAGLVDLAERVERAGFAWAPSPDDLHICDGVIAVARLRGTRSLVRGEERLDAKAVLEAAGAAILPQPAVSGPPRLLRLIVRHRTVEPALRTVEHCRRELATITSELEIPADSDATLSALCDAGFRRDHNEDAYAIASGETRGERWTILVVCDGVSSSTHAEQASQIAAKTTCDVLAHFARSGDIAFEAATSAMSQAIRAAHLAICAQRIEHASQTEPPGTTIVAGLVYRNRLTVGWVGDSRAYWVSPQGSELLTRDHSWANEAVARGEMTEAEAMQAPLAHALTKCLGPLEIDDGIAEVDPDVRGRDLPGAGHVVLCSDGLWNYFPQAADIAALVKDAGAASPERKPSPGALARFLVNNALARGGQDNVTVAVFEHS